MSEATPRAARFGDLRLRVASGLALAAFALAVVWMGGFVLALAAAAAAALMLWELRRIATGEGAALAPRMLLLGGAGALGALAAWGAGPGAAIAVILVGAAASFVVEPKARGLLAGGLVYLAAAMAFLVAMRGAQGGFALVLWLVLVVIAADVGAYFVGRAVGGAKLWPAVSPGKTWSGAFGGLAAALVVGLAFAATQGWGLGRAGLLSVGAAVASQAGDLIESAVKRRYGVKDASALIPGHGGLMDRLDGIMGGLWFLALWGALGGSQP